MTEQEIRDCGIPEYMIDGVLRYIEYGVCGDFLQAVLQNDLAEAAGRADAVNSLHLHNYALLLYRMPLNLWGSKAAVKEHQQACAEKRRMKDER